jgi:hypothetical protein
MAPHDKENAFAEFANLGIEQVLRFGRFAHQHGVRDIYFGRIFPELTVLRPEVDWLRLLGVKHDATVLGYDGWRGNDMEDHKLGAQFLCE